MNYKIEFNIQNLEELEMLEAGLWLAAGDAKHYYSASTPQNAQDRKILAYWKHRAELLTKFAKETKEVKI